MAKHIAHPIIEEMTSMASSHILFRNIKDSRYAFFLDSATDHKKLGRYSLMGSDPFLVFKSKGDSVTLEWEDGKTETFKSNPFSALRELFKEHELASKDDKLPFVGGGVGYFSYDMKEFVERLPDTAIDDLNLPDCIFGFYDTAMAYDNLDGKGYITSLNPKRLETFKDRLYKEPGGDEGAFISTPPILKSNFSIDSYVKAIEKAKEYIRMGDIYQVNLSQRFETERSVEPFELYSRLRDFSPAPFASYLNFEDIVILSSSPERFLLKRGDYIETRPIKGTRPRGQDPLTDILLKKELAASGKDRAEHVMIVDLERNDLGRICEYGSVRPTEFIITEKYSTVFHLVSTVSGRLRRGIGPVDCLLATFPGGSITGAPKIRAMEIIDELEPVKRSIYTGAIGYISFNGNMDSSIVIRTFIIKGKKVFFSVGGGIVADSDPQSEYNETIDKARGLMQSLGIGLAKIDKVFA